MIPRATVILQDWKTLYDEVKAMRMACGTDGRVHMKSILATGELPTLKVLNTVLAKVTMRISIRSTCCRACTKPLSYV